MVGEQELVREPSRPNQGETAVTEQLTGVRLDLELCGVCSQTRGVSDHHIRFRSRGGKKGGTIPLCVRCHDKVTEGVWKIVRLDDGLQIVDVEGEIIWRLLRWPFGGSAAEFVQLLDKVVEVEKLMPDMAPALLPWQAVQVFDGLRTVGEGGWRAQMGLIAEFYRYRLPGLSSPDRVVALCQLFGVRRSQLYNHLTIAQAFGDSPAVQETLLSMGYLIEAARTEEPEKWLGFAEERKLTHPTFSRDDLRQEIVRAGARKYQPAEPAGGTVPALSKVWGRCGECQHVGWMEKLPVGSTGEPVEMAEGQS